MNQLRKYKYSRIALMLWSALFFGFGYAASVVLPLVSKVMQ